MWTLAVGYQFYWIIIGSDPSARRFPHLGRLGLVFAVMPFHAVFAMIVISVRTTIAANYYRTIDRPWTADLLADQRLGRVVSLVTGELALVIAQVVLLIQWHRYDHMAGFDRIPTKRTRTRQRTAPCSRNCNRAAAPNSHTCVDFSIPAQWTQDHGTSVVGAPRHLYRDDWSDRGRSRLLSAHLSLCCAESRRDETKARMSVSIRQIRTRYHTMVVAGAAIAIAGSVIGFLRMFRGDSQMVHGMPMSDMPEMFVAGAGILVALVGALLRGAPRTTPRTPVPAAERFHGRRGRRVVAFVATAALTIDISKTSTLGFVIPGMRAEYGLGPSAASMLAVAGLSGTATGALLFSRLADRIGRRTSYVIATLGFTATSLCAGMPTFAGNVVMCFLMGLAVGGLAPLLITILTDLFPGGARGPVVTGLSVVATAIGYLVASGSALWLEPTYGWRVLWLIGAPTGLLLTLLTVLIPHRAPAPAAGTEEPQGHPRQLERTAFTIRLQWLYAGTIGLLTFGLTTWVPTLARAGDLSLTTANTLLTAVAVAMMPGAVLVAAAYRRFGTIPLAVTMAVCTATLLLALAASGLTAVSWLSAAVLAASLFAVNTMAAIFLPIAADLADSPTRGRTTGTVSFFNRLGGLIGPLALSFIVSSLTDMLTAIAVLALLCGAIAWYTGRRGRATRARLEPEPVTSHSSST